MKAVSVVINTLNRAKLLSDALKSLERQEYPEFEIIVVNGPSTDHTGQVLESYRGAIKILSCPEPNLSMSRNIGICASAGEIVAFIDDDAVADPRWLQGLVAGYDADEVAGVGGFVYDHTGAEFQCRYNICDRFGTTIPSVDVDPTDLFSMPGAFYYPSVIGTNSSFKREALLEIAGFDEAYIYNTDETDVCLRLVDRGYRIKIVPDALVYHRYAASYMRDHRKVPITLYPSAVCKSYFAFRNGLPASSPQQVYAELNRYEAEVRQSLEWLYNQHAIDRSRLESLQDDISRGLQDGMVKALCSAERRTITADARSKLMAPYLRFDARALPGDGKLRIGLMTGDYPPEKTGGVGRWTYLLAMGLTRLGHEVHVLALGRGHNTVTFEDNVWVHRLVPVPSPYRRLDLPFSLPEIAVDHMVAFKTELDRCSEETPFNIISSPIWLNPGLAALIEPRYPVLITLHSAYALIQPHKIDWHELTPYYLNHVAPMIAMEKYVFAHAPFLIANSRPILEEYESAFGASPAGRVYVVPHGIEPVEGAEGRCGEIEVCNVLYVGRLERRKGIDLLLAVIPDLCARFPYLRFTICGEEVGEDPTERPYAERFRESWGDDPAVSGRVNFTGYVAEDELQRLYGSCQIFVAPSRFESFGLIFIEAMAHGKPVIALEAGGATEIIDSGVDGILVPPEDTSALAAAIARLAEDGALRSAMGKAAKLKFQRQYTTEKMAVQMVAAYRDVIRQRNQILDQKTPRAMAPREALSINLAAAAFRRRRGAEITAAAAQ